MAILWKFWNFLTVETRSGWKALLGGAIYLFILALGASFAKSIKIKEDGHFEFDWHFFWIILGGFVAIGIAQRLFERVVRGTKFFGPHRGHAYRIERKRQTSGILMRLTNEIKNIPISRDVAIHIITDLLDLMVLHIRDARGSHNRNQVDVFASLILPAETRLVVVARDSNSNGPSYLRETPRYYDRASMLAGRAISARRALSTGDLRKDYPEAPRNKPYRSILCVPILAKDAETVIGVISFDSNRPYLFTGFWTGSVEDELEDSLQPYLTTMTMILEGFIKSDNGALDALMAS